MYRRPGQKYKYFIIEEKKGSVSSIGRPLSKYNADKPKHLKAVLAEADFETKQRFNQEQHPITHTLVQKGKPIAKKEERLIFGDRIFLIQGVENPGELGVYTLYYCEERSDLRG